MSHHRTLLTKKVYLLACTLGIIGACSPANTTPGVSNPQASGLAASVTENPAQVKPSPVASPVTAEGSIPEASSSPPDMPSSIASPEISSGPSVTLQDISVAESTTFNGKVFDDGNAPLDGVKVSVKSLNTEVSYRSETMSVGGAYAFNNAPAGIQLEITAEKEGYTTRRRVEVLKSNKEGAPNANRYDFGTDGTGTAFGVLYSALSDKPEVTQVMPDRNASAVTPNTSFTLTFSEPMDRKTVEDNFEIRAYTDEKLGIDTSSAGNTLTGSKSIGNTSGTRMWDKSAFLINWNSDDTQVTFSFAADRKLPTDKDNDRVPDYQISLERQDKSIKDKQGTSRSAHYFKLSEGDFERSYKFSILSDKVSPGVSDIIAATAENSNGSTGGDRIKLRFTEPMVYYTLGPTLAGGMGGDISHAPAANNSITGADAAQNYTLTVNRGGTLIYNQIRWSELGGTVVFDSNDPTHRTVLLVPPVVKSESLINSRPEAQDNVTLTATFEDGSSQTLNTGIFQTSGPGLTHFFEAQYNVANSGASRAIELTFVYTDGTSESLRTGALDTTPSAVELQGLLNGLTNASPWNIVDSTGGDILAGDVLSISLAQGSSRLSTVPVHGNKRIAWVLFSNEASTAFANDALGQDGTQEATRIVPLNGDAGVVEAALNQGLDGQGTDQKLTITENTATAGLFEAGDALNITLNGSPTVGGKPFKRLTISQSGMFESNDLNAPAEGLSLFVGASAGSAVDLYRAGDNVFIKVNTTVLDPAGNSLDSSSESANAIAS